MSRNNASGVLLLSGRARIKLIEQLLEREGRRVAISRLVWRCGNASTCEKPLASVRMRQRRLALNASMLHEISRHPLLAKHHVRLRAPFQLEEHREPQLATFESGDGGGPEVYAYNPSVLDADNFLVKVSRFSFCGGLPAQRRALDAPVHAVFWLQHGGVRGAIDDADDVRAFRLDGRVHALFTRVSATKIKRVARKQMFLAALEPTHRYREVRLRLVDRAVKSGNRRKADDAESPQDEANWMPFVFGGQLFVSYTVCPHRVLRCNIITGECREAHRTEPDGGCPRLHGARGRTLLIGPGSWPADAHSDATLALHGGTQLVPIGNHHGHDGRQQLLIGLAHFKLYAPSKQPKTPPLAWWYLTVLICVDAFPPFALRGVSAPFELPPAFHNGYHDRIQFAAGAAVINGGGAGGAATTLRVSYGAGDCASLVASLPLSRAVNESLRGLQTYWRHTEFAERLATLRERGG